MTRRSALSIKRTHGLGNLIMLLPVIDRLIETGVPVHLITQPEWITALRQGRPEVDFSSEVRAETIDLDGATLNLLPSAHRSTEFAHILGVSGPLKPPRLLVPPEWSAPFAQYQEAVIFAPESGHPARTLAPEKLYQLALLLQGEKLILTGLHQQLYLPAHTDLRGKLSLSQLLGLLRQARAVLCFDSGMLHLAMACDVPVMAVFGGIDPAFRVFPQQRAKILQAKLDCCPCNKAETCHGRYPCLRDLGVTQVFDEFAALTQVSQREIIRLKTAEWIK